MSDLTLRINADFDKAQKAFKELADSSEETRKKIENFADAFQDKQINSFIDKQKLLEAALTGTRGEVSAMQAASKNYKTEIERLIKSGLSPQSEAVQRLSQEQKLLELKIKETTNAQKAQQEAMKNLETASMAFIGAVTAASVAVLAMTNETAKLGDELAKTSAKLGMTAEELQELDYAAKMSGVQDIRSHLEKLSKSIIDVKNDTGNLTKYLQENDAALLQQVKSAKSNSQAFDLIINAVKNTHDPFKKSELAMAAFGKAGQDLILMANQGTESINSLKEEARQYGIISNEAASQAEKYIDAQTRLQTALCGVKNEIGNALMPIITDVMQKVADTVSSVDDWDKVFNKLISTVTAVTSSVVTFLAVMKIAPVIQGAVTAVNAAGGALAALRIKILAVNTAIAANPIGLIATAIAAGVGIIVGAITNAVNKQREYTNSVNDNTNAVNRNIRAQDALASMSRRGTFETSAMYNNINELLTGRLNTLALIERHQREAREREAQGWAAGATASRNNAQTHIEHLNKIEDRLRILAALQGQVFLDGRIQNEPAAPRQAQVQIEVLPITTNNIDTAVKTSLEIFKENLEQRIDADKSAQNEMTAAAKTFFQQYADLETSSIEERLIFLREQKEQMTALYEEGSMERIAIEKVADEAIKNSKKDLADYERNLLEQRMNANAQFFGGLSQLLQIAGEKNQKAAIASKAFAMVEAGINTALAATKSLTAAPFPWNIALMAGTVAAGVAQQIKIATASIPSAETGGRFIVPQGNGVDDKLYRFNGGEEINVTPKGMTNNDSRESFNFNLVIDNEIMAKVTNKLARAGELYTLQLSGNL